MNKHEKDDGETNKNSNLYNKEEFIIDLCKITSQEFESHYKYNTIDQEITLKINHKTNTNV